MALLFQLFSSTNLLITVICLLFVYVLWMRRNLYIVSYKLPGPFALPLIGNVYIRLFLHNTEDIFRCGYNYMRKNGTPFRLWFGTRLVIVVSDPEDLEIICNNSDCYERDVFVMKSMRAAVGDGILTSTVSKWRGHRKLLNPTFSTKILNGFVKIFVANAKILVENLKEHVDKPDFNIKPAILHTTTKSICDTSMGTDEQDSNSLSMCMDDILEEAMDTAVLRMTSPWLYPDFLFNLTERGRNFNKYVNYGSSIIYEKIMRKKQSSFLLQRNIDDKSKIPNDLDLNDDIKVRQPKVLIDLLMELNENGQGFTDTEVRDQILTFLIAGSDTTSIAINYACVLLGSHPEQQEKAYLEIKEIFGDSNRDLEVGDLAKLQYLDRVIKETLRIFPIIPFTVRYMPKDVQLSTTLAPAGSTLLVAYILPNRDPKIYPDPLKFDPDRFLPEEVAKRHPYCYLPFGRGSRNCIGNRYAMMTLKIILCILLQTYTFKSNIDIENMRLAVAITLKDVVGHGVELKLRKK